jgi:hypothetical protein
VSPGVSLTFDRLVLRHLVTGWDSGIEFILYNADSFTIIRDCVYEMLFCHPNLTYHQHHTQQVPRPKVSELKWFGLASA